MCTVPGQRLYIAQSGSDFYLWKQPEDECYKIEGVKSRKVLIKAIKQTGVEGLSLKQLKSLELSICGGQEPPTPWPFNEM
ncbi:uncharacterized protein N7443_006550 [Penicillium atrosanguineum]|nr:uncharacterized protein N7443_006550 [Penicillium atrosanguineum]KAJ5298430.1 hypothetical protein N7443_006550 [Penicillium atrosanguineum]